LRVSSIAGSPGETIEVEISLDAPAGKAPAALKWETVFPAQLIEMEGDGPSPGGAAKESGKSLACTTTKSYFISLQSCGRGQASRKWPHRNISF
jgi:hypothetical protein